MNYYIATDRFGNYDLCHHGIKGQKWGVRRYQNEDGTWTEAGKKRYENSGSISGGASRVIAKVYDINEKFYSKNNRNKTLASMNKTAKEQALAKAAAKDAARRKRLLEKDSAKIQKEKERINPRETKDPEIRKMAEDYHKLSEIEFFEKHKTTRKSFAKMYSKYGRVSGSLSEVTQKQIDDGKTAVDYAIKNEKHRK